MATTLRTTLRALEDLATGIGATVRYEDLKIPKTSRDPAGSVARGGLVRVGGRTVILCEQRLPVVDKVAVVAEALASLGVELLHLPPLMRARIGRSRAPRPRIVARRASR